VWVTLGALVRVDVGALVLVTVGGEVFVTVGVRVLVGCTLAVSPGSGVVLVAITDGSVPSGPLPISPFSRSRSTPATV
jgi:hypothetical protein